MALGMAVREALSRPEVRGVPRLKKPDNSGMAYYCDACGKTISYKSSGKKAFHLHAEDAKHKASFRTVKSNQVSRFLYLSNWKKVVL